MSYFTFYNKNLIDSVGTLQIIYNGTTGTADSLSSLIDRTPNHPFTTTIAAVPVIVIHASLSAEKVINNIMFQNMNFQRAQVNVNSGTVALLSTTEGTGTSNWSGLSVTNLILNFASMTASVIDVYIYSVTSVNLEIGQFIACETQFTLPRNPNYSDYKPVLTGMRLEKEMADGGTVIYSVSEKFKADIGLNWVPGSVTNEYYSMWSGQQAYTFTPFPTTTSWEGELYEINLVGEYDFKNMMQNSRTIPFYKGTIRLAETPL